MTRIVETTQAEVDREVARLIPNPASWKDSMTVRFNGSSYSFSFQELRKFLARGMALRIQSHERPSSASKMKAEKEKVELELHRLREIAKAKGIKLDD